MTSFRSYRIVKKKKNRKIHTQTHCNCRVLESYAAGTCYKRVHDIMLSLSLFPAIYYFSRSVSVIVLSLYFSLSLSFYHCVCPCECDPCTREYIRQNAVLYNMLCYIRAATMRSEEKTRKKTL